MSVSQYLGGMSVEDVIESLKQGETDRLPDIELGEHVLEIANVAKPAMREKASVIEFTYSETNSAQVVVGAPCKLYLDYSGRTTSTKPKAADTAKAKSIGRLLAFLSAAHKVSSTQAFVQKCGDKLGVVIDASLNPDKAKNPLIGRKVRVLVTESGAGVNPKTGKPYTSHTWSVVA